MNSTYPKTTSDFDKEFLWYLLNGVFTKAELKLCGNASSLRTLKPDKLKFVKGKSLNYCYESSNYEYNNWFSLIYINNLAIFAQRVDGDKKRMDSFRQNTMEISQRIWTAAKLQIDSSAKQWANYSYSQLRNEHIGSNKFLITIYLSVSVQQSYWL